MSSIPIKENRIVFLDVLRGFTLLGIGLIHMVEQYYAGAHPQTHQNFHIDFLGDEIAAGLVGFLISGKFFVIFSFLFGLSFYLQIKDTNGKPGDLIRFVWRLIILLLIGLLHHLHYRGDILTIYAILGILLVIANQLSDRALLVLSLLLVLNVPSLVARTTQLFLSPENTDPFAIFNSDEKAKEIYFNTLKNGSYWAILKANFYEHSGKMIFQVFSGRIYITAGLFMLGLYAGRKKIFDQFDENKFRFKKALKLSLWSMLGCVVAGAIYFGAFTLAGVQLSQQHQFAVGGFLYDAFNAAQALLYVSGLALLFNKPAWQKRLMVFNYPGRMGLTTYLLQTVFGVFIFFGVGLGLLGDIGALTTIGLSIVFFIIQVLISRLWFSKFQYGPVEWLWRSATKLQMQPLKMANA
jgi:uncharacterized protein